MTRHTITLPTTYADRGEKNLEGQSKDLQPMRRSPFYQTQLDCLLSLLLAASLLAATHTEYFKTNAHIALQSLEDILGFLSLGLMYINPKLITYNIAPLTDI